MSEYESINLSPEMKKRIRDSRKNPPVGFKCWDCRNELSGVEGLHSEEFKKSPIDIDGYIGDL